MTTQSKGNWMIRWDESRLEYEIGAVTARMSARIAEEHTGTTNEKDALVSDITAMCRALKRAVADGGRKTYDEELTRWKGYEFYKEFVRCMDSAMTRMPRPRNRPVTQP